MKLVPIAIAILFLPFFQIPVCSVQPPPGQDWMIDQDTIISNETIFMDWNLTVRSGARLELHNVSLDFNFTEANLGGILVEAGASLLMDRCTLNGLVFTNRTSYFVVYGNLELIDSKIFRVGSYNGIYGIQLLGGNNIFRGITFYDITFTDKIYLDHSYLDIQNCGFETDRCRGIVAEQSTLDVANCTFVGSLRAIMANYSSARITDCLFLSSEKCCELRSCSAKIQGCDFGSRRQTFLPVQAQPTPLTADLLIQGCEFISNSYSGVMLSHWGYGEFYSGWGLLFVDPRETIIFNDSFQLFPSYGYDIAVSSTDDVLVLSNRFLMTRGVGVRCEGFLKDQCLIKGNQFEDGIAIVALCYVRIEGNNISLNKTHWQGDAMVYCGGPAEIIQNNMTTVIDDSGPGILINNHYDDYTTDISHNRIEGSAYGVFMDASYGPILVHDNIITNCTNGIYAPTLYFGTDIRRNIISKTDYGIYVENSRSSVGYVTHIQNNSIQAAYRAIDAYPMSSPLEISGNSIISDRSGIEVYGQSNCKPNITIDDNTISANETGIIVKELEANLTNSSLARNIISNCSRGIDVEYSTISPKANRMENISEWGIYALDAKGDFNGSVSYFNSSAPNASRVVRLWTLTFDVEYNANGPGDPEKWYSVNKFNLNARDNMGAEAYDEQMYYLEGRIFREYKELGDGARVDYNPYRLTASSPKQGVGRAALVINTTQTLKLYLKTGPDLIARSVDISEQSPIEGQLIFICGTATNNNSYNPNSIMVFEAQLLLWMDGEILTHLPIEYFANGSLQSISTAWVASPGWHNVSLSVIAPFNVTDVLPDNNILTRKFYVARLPVSRLITDGTDLDAWENVNFSIEVNSSDAITGYRYDFGDGSASDWLASPNISHVFSSAGEYTVRGWVATSRGAVRECSEPLRVTINYPPSALELFANPDPAPSNSPVLFIARLAPRVGNISSAIWQFGDGSNHFGENAAVASHAYGTPGNYTVTVTVNIAQGGTLIRQLVISVLNSPPEAAGRISPPGGDATTVFSFVSESVDGDGMISACRWELGDGNSSYSPQALHTYANHGTYTVTLTVQDDQGDWSAPASFFITVNNTLPSVRMRAGRLGSAGADTYVFDGYGTSDLDDPAQNLSYRWDFGDGTTAEGINVTHKFPSPGGFEVTLTVGDGAGGQASRTVTVHVPGAPAQPAGWMVPAIVVAAVVIALWVLVLGVLIASRRKNGPNPRLESQKNGKRVNSLSSRTAPKSIYNVTRVNNDRSK